MKFDFWFYNFFLRYGYIIYIILLNIQLWKSHGLVEIFTYRLNIFIIKKHIN